MAEISIEKWLRIIAEIIKIIFGGHSREEAVSMVSKMYDIPEEEIYEHGGF